MFTNRVVAFWVGVLMVLACLGLAFLALSVSGLNLSSFGAKYYTVTESFNAVDNLKVRAPVRLAGVEIGQVTHISLNPKTLEAVVQMRIDSQFNEIPKDTVGQIAQSSLLGDNYVKLEPGVASHYLENGDRLQSSQKGSGGLMSAISSFLGGGDSGINPSLRGDSYYQISEVFPTIGGLQLGAPVKISGVQVGQVVNIKLNPDTFEPEVTMSISKRFSNLPMDSVGQIASVSLLGGNYVNINPGVMPTAVKPGESLQKRGIGPTELGNLISTFMSKGSEDKS